jgi:hypothetical protein
MTPEEMESRLLYEGVSNFAKGICTNVQIFIDAFGPFIDKRLWENGWYDEVRDSLMHAPSLREFITRPVPEGIGSSISWVFSTLDGAAKLGCRGAGDLHRAFTTEVPDAEAEFRQTVKQVMEPAPPVDHAAAGAKGGRGHKASSNTTGFDRGSTYLLRRLKRDRPDLAERVIAGEMSANAAAIEAGFRKKAKRCCPNCGHQW